MPSHNGIKTESNASIPYGADASAKAESERAVIVLFFYSSSFNPFSTISTKLLRWGKTAQPINIANY